MRVNTWQTNLIQGYLRVLDDSTYEKDIPFRRSMFPFERTLLNTCLDNLDLAQEEYTELSRRCGPLSDRTKQSLEINEEDHGKAIMIFTIVTVIFLPLSFVTSYLGMNTADIRDMDNRQSLFWIISIPLTVVTVGTCLLIGYNGDELRDAVSSLYRTATGKQDRRTSARGISVAQRKRARKLQSESSSTLESSGLADEAEFASPRPDYEYGQQTYMTTYAPGVGNDWYASHPETTTVQMQKYGRTAEVRTQSYTEKISMAPMSPPPPPPPPPGPSRISSARRRFNTEDDDALYDRRERSRYDSYPDLRRRRGPYDAYQFDKGEYIPRPYSPPPSRRYEEYEEEREPGTTQEYTWHKKRSRGRRYARNIYR
jgi:hypothetical protein